MTAAAPPCPRPAPASVLWPALGLAALGLANALLLVWGSGQGTTGDTARQLAAVLASTGLGAAALLWITLDSRFARLPLRWVLVLALLLRLIAIQASPLLEDDHFRYLWDGLRTATGLDPYRLPPSAFFGDPALAPQWQDVLSGINNPDTPTLYGPVLQGLFALAHLWAPAKVQAIQALLLALDMTVLALLAHQGVSVRGLLVYAVHPLVLKEAMASAHPDGLVALLLLLAVLAWQQRRATVVGAMLGLAVCAKVAALVALPMLLLPPRQPAGAAVQQRGAGKGWLLCAMAGFCVTVGVLYLPFWWVGGSDAAGLATFGGEWRFNPLLYRLIELLVPAPAARPVAALLIAAGIAGLVWRWRWRDAARTLPEPTLPPLDSALVLLILLSPVVNPWYWLWALALSLRRGQGWLAAAAVAAPLAHLNSTVLAQTEITFFGLPDGAFAVVWPALAAQLLALGLAWHWRRRLQL